MVTQLIITALNLMRSLQKAFQSHAPARTRHLQPTIVARIYLGKGIENVVLRAGRVVTVVRLGMKRPKRRTERPADRRDQMQGPDAALQGPDAVILSKGQAPVPQKADGASHRPKGPDAATRRQDAATRGVGQAQAHHKAKGSF
jgi:hypothetical protein